MVDHPVLVTGPVLLERTDQNFIPAILDELRSKETRDAMPRASTRNENSVLRLFQPVHRTFHVALFDVACDTPGRPRLDPEKIVSAGLVLRRAGTSANTVEAWVKAGQKVRGWAAFPTPAQAELDPDPDQRKPLLTTGNAELDRRIAALRPVSEPLTETTAPLYAAPPDVCAEAKRTFYYGMIPVVSAEFTEAPNERTYTADFVRDHLPSYFREASGKRTVPKSNQTLTAASAEDKSDTLLQSFIVMLRQVLIEFDAFGDSPQSKAVFAALNRIRLPFDDDTSKPAGDVLKTAAEVLVNLDPGQQVRMPKEWPPVSAADQQAIVQAVKASLDAKLAAFVGGRGRFEDPAALYRIRAFFRVRRSDGCPPALVWSEYSEPFTIVQWHESGNLPPVQVSLPDITRASVRNLKPNVTFNVPSNLFNFIQSNDPKDLMDGKGNQGGGIALDWICGFNIPVITICAFIVLSIFLALFHIIFWWLPFIRICIPFPFPKRS